MVIAFLVLEPNIYKVSNMIVVKKAILNQLKALSLFPLDLEREKKITEILPQIVRAIEGETLRNQHFQEVWFQEFWEDFKEVLSRLQLETKRVNTADEIGSCIISINNDILNSAKVSNNDPDEKTE